jgi:hypothetical protein
MCKRSFSVFVARPKKPITTRNSRAVVDVKAASIESDGYDEDPTLRELKDAGGTPESIKSRLCNLTNDLHPVFDARNICVCKNRDRRDCYLPDKVTALESATDKLEGSLEPHWDRPLGNFMIHSALQLATRVITHEDTLPFWAGLIDCAKSSKDEEAKEFHVRARKRIDAAKEKEVLDYLTYAAGRIRIHLMSFEEAGESAMLDVENHGFVQSFDHWKDPSNYDQDSPDGIYGWTDGKPAFTRNTSSTCGSTWIISWIANELRTHGTIRQFLICDSVCYNSRRQLATNFPTQWQISPRTAWGYPVSTKKP